MKIKATQDAWYRKKKIREGQIVDYKEPEVPCWGTLANGEELPECKKEEENRNANLKDEEELDEQDEDEVKEEPNEPDELDEQDEEEPEKQEEMPNIELDKKLELLRDLAVENDVWVEIPDECTVEKEVKLLQGALESKQIKLNF